MKVVASRSGSGPAVAAFWLLRDQVSVLERRFTSHSAKTETRHGLYLHK